MTGTWLGYYKYANEKLQKAYGFDKTYFTITINSFDKGFFAVGVGINAGTGLNITEKFSCRLRWCHRQHSLW